MEQIEHVLRENGTLLVPALIPANASRDPSDAHVLGLAVVGQAECLVTGDKDLLVLKRFKQCQVISPREFSVLIHQK